MKLGMALNLREENGKEKWDCDGDLSKAIKIMESMEGIDVPATIDYLQSNGCSCDCEILLNVDTVSEEAKNFDINYRLDYSPSHGSLHTALISTMRNLPREIREFALDNCFFLSMEEGLNGTIVRCSPTTLGCSPKRPRRLSLHNRFRVTHHKPKVCRPFRFPDSRRRAPGQGSRDTFGVGAGSV